MITKAIIPAAGLGTRMLPLTKAQSKEMLPLAGKPCIQYIVEELAAVGIKQILFITGQKKRAIEDHFDKDMDLNRLLSGSGQKDLLSALDYEDLDIQFFYTRQSVPAGLGDAVNHARDFVGNDPFIVALGDAVIHSSERTPLLARMLQQYQEHPGSIILGTREVPVDAVSKYGIIKPRKTIDDELVEIEDVIEKPSPANTPSNLAFAARYILPAGLFDALNRTSPGKGGEIQLTDGIRLLLKEGTQGFGVKLTAKEKRYDIGGMASYYEAFVDFALMDEKYGYQLRQYLVNKFKL
jgi:UTP--glucose-1-phosphate uridylyltransferase